MNGSSGSSDGGMARSSRSANGEDGEEEMWLSELSSSSPSSVEASSHEPVIRNGRRPAERPQSHPSEHPRDAVHRTVVVLSDRGGEEMECEGFRYDRISEKGAIPVRNAFTFHRWPLPQADSDG